MNKTEASKSAAPSYDELLAAARELRNAERDFDSVSGYTRLRGAVREKALEKARARRVNARVAMDDLIAAATGSAQ